MKRVTAMSRH